jgi:hypothetical protein
METQITPNSKSNVEGKKKKTPQCSTSNYAIEKEYQKQHGTGTKQGTQTNGIK